MPDNPPSPEGAPQPPAPSPGGNPPQRPLPPVPPEPPPGKKTTGKIVVLSSVAKPPPSQTQPLGKMLSSDAPRVVPPQIVQKAGPLPATPGVKRTTPIKLNLPTAPKPPASDNDSIFVIDNAPPIPVDNPPEGWKQLEPGELPSDLKLDNIDIFAGNAPAGETSQPKAAPVPEAKEPFVPPTVTPPAIAKAKDPQRPPPLPSAKPAALTSPLLAPVKALAEKAELHKIHVAPPMTAAKAGVTIDDKRPQPNLRPEPVKAPEPVKVPEISKLPEPLKGEMPTIVVSKLPDDSSAGMKVPALIKPEAPVAKKLPPPLPLHEPIKLVQAPPSPEPASSPAPTLPEIKKPESVTPLVPVVDAKPSAVTGPILAKETKLPEVAEKLTPPPVIPPEKPKAVEPLTPAPGSGSIVKSGGVTGPILNKENRPALRPPVLPSKMLAKVEKEKDATSPETAAKADIPPLGTSTTPPATETKASTETTAREAAPAESKSPEPAAGEKKSGSPKLPPPLPSRPAAKAGEAVPPQLVAKPAEVIPAATPLPETKPAAITGPILGKESKAETAGEKVVPPPSLPEAVVTGQPKPEEAPKAPATEVKADKPVTTPEQAISKVSGAGEKAKEEPAKTPEVKPAEESKPASDTVKKLDDAKLPETKSVVEKVAEPVKPAETKPAESKALEAKSTEIAKSAESIKTADTAKAADKSSVTPHAPPMLGHESGAKHGDHEKLKSPVHVGDKTGGDAHKTDSHATPVELKSAAPVALPFKKKEKVPVPSTREARARRKKIFSIGSFYIVMGFALWGLYHYCMSFGHETRIEGQLIPPNGTLLNGEVWVVSDFRDLVSSVAEDLANERTPKIEDIQEKQGHLQRAQADIASREEKIRLLQTQIQGIKDDINNVVKQARDATQAIWSGPGAQLDDEYDARLAALKQTIQNRATSLKLHYVPDNTYNSPEVWANAYRLALYEVPPGVDSGKEHLWLEDQMTKWRAFTKDVDDRKEKLREQAATIRQSPLTKVADLQAKIDDLQHRIDSTAAEEVPIRTELQQAQGDLVQVQTVEAGLDGKYYQQLYSIPEANVTKRIPVRSNGRFSWRNLEQEKPFAEGETEHSFWLFSRAVRTDGRQYWALFHVTVGKDQTLSILVEPVAFTSTKAMLRPDLSPDEQSQ